MLRGRPRLVRAVPRRLSHNARHYGTSSVVIPAISPRRGRADAAPFFRLALRRSGCRRRLALSHAAPGAPNPTPPIPPTPGARGALSASPPRAAATPSSGRRTAPDQTGDRASKARTKRRRKRPPLRGRIQRPPLPPRTRGGRSASPPRCKTFSLGAGAAGKDRTARVGAARASPTGAAAPPRYHTPRPCLPPWPRKSKKRRPLSAQKKCGRGARHGPSQMKTI